MNTLTRALILFLLGLTLAAGCKRATPMTPETPTVPNTPTVPTGPSVSGTLVNGISTLAIAGAAVRVDGLGETTSAADGKFALSAPETVATRIVTISSGSTVERSAWLSTPGAAGTLPLMPATIDLTAFNEMFRGNLSTLRRWTTAPKLLIQRNTLAFTNVTDLLYTATSSSMSDSAVNVIASDLTWALPQLTGNTFNAFATQGTEDATEGDRISVVRTGTIHVARYRGLTIATGFAGYGRWSWNGSGEIVMGTVMLDENVELSDSFYRRALHAHEMGHALGYNHVTARSSVMNTSAQIEPNTFDRDGARIAFLRPLLNRSPDADPDPATTMALDTGKLWFAGAP